MSLFGLGSVRVGGIPAGTPSSTALSELVDSEGAVRWLRCTPDGVDQARAEPLDMNWGQKGPGYVIKGPVAISECIGSVKTINDLFPIDVVKFPIRHDEVWHVSEFGSRLRDHLDKLGILPHGKPVQAIYSDRYIHSPLQFRMMRELIQAFDPETITIHRRRKEEDRSHWREPWEWWDDYPAFMDVDNSRIEEAIKSLFPSPHVEVRSGTRGTPMDPPHDRSLIVAWANGVTLKVSLGQGVSGWRQVKAAPSPFRSIRWDADHWVERMSQHVVNASITVRPEADMTFFVERMS